MRIALIGQPNCGKSTIFNQLAGYKAETGNFSGTTVSFTESKVRVMGTIIEIVDLPGTYSLIGTNPAEKEVLRYLLDHSVDGIINVLDASRLSHGLNLTMELLRLDLPVVIALNMVDEADRIGLELDLKLMSGTLGVPVLPLIASHGKGIKNLMMTALRTAQNPSVRNYSVIPDGLGDRIKPALDEFCSQNASCISPSIFLTLVETPEVADLLGSQAQRMISSIEKARKLILDSYLQEPDILLTAYRKSRVDELLSVVQKNGARRYTLRDRVDDILLHPFWGYIFLVAIMFVFFQVIYTTGSILERPILKFFEMVTTWASGYFQDLPLVGNVVHGIIQGISGGSAIVLPYLIPFLLGLGLLEDVGYLPRIAFLMDSLMHRLGLHGKAIVPFILGYGCNVPAIMSTRMMEDGKERYLAAALAVLVPCAARLSVVFGLVAYYLGPLLALAIYLFNLFVIAITAKILSRMIPEDTPGLILEMPVYRLPTFRTVFSKAWFRIREFVIEAWPVLIGGSVIFALMEYFSITRYFNVIFSPLSWILGLPSSVGVPLIFGVLRKELSLIMLKQALGGVDFGSALSPVQMVTFSVFVVFYVPCLATLAVLRKELGTRSMISIAGITVLIATVAALAARILFLMVKI